ncbi:rhamnan synthesis F family protein [Agrococcus sp. KRD186]|jgi:rhamnosyltransferase|uniref:rhamnan synthesis F family protein n=1 Tax=Agrococcus sp. KRD186 TaxID=2729730 RepID=UPI0019D296C6|nr:rhamnan synthesis F family protein [Agrococcus sp. KRD186]
MTAAATRLAIVAHRDPRGEVGDRVDLLVAGLRTITDRVVLVADALSAAGRERADALADRVVVAQAGSVLALIAAGLAAVDDEVCAAASVLVTDTERYGPLPDRDMLGILAAGAPTTGAWTWTPTAPRQHLEPSPWLWAHRDAFDGETWRRWWRAARDDRDTLGVHDLVLALQRGGARVSAIRSHQDERIQRAVLEVPLEQPFFERLLFTADPGDLEQHALGDPGAWRMLQGSGYPMRVIARDLQQAAPPRQVATTIGAMRVLERWPEELSAGPRPRLAVIAHVYYPEALPEIGVMLQHMPVDWTLIVTTGSEESKAAIEHRFEREVSSWLQRLQHFEVRVVESNRGRDISAFLLGCSDVLRTDAAGGHPFDVVLKLHSKRSPQDPYPRATRFQEHVLGSLLGAPHALLQLFIDEPELGMAMPPQIHVGYPTLGRAWFGNRPLAERLARRLGIDVPFDDGSPLAPFGSMFAARPEALRPLVDSLGWHDFPDESGYRDGGVAHAVERLFAYAAISEGYIVRTVTSPEVAAESHQMLEWKLQEILQDVPGTSRQQVQLASAATRAAAAVAGPAVRVLKGLRLAARRALWSGRGAR